MSTMVNVWRIRRTQFWKITRVTRPGCSRPVRSLGRQFGRPNFIEVAFARFKLVDGKVCSFVYSHRIYGEKIGDQASAWLSANGAEIEKALMEWTSMPSSSSLRQYRTRAL